MTTKEPQDFDQRLGHVIVARRNALGLRQGELSDALRHQGVNWSQGTLSRVELGLRPVRFSEVNGVALALGTTPAKLADMPDMLQQCDQSSVVLDAAIRAIQDLKLSIRGDL